MEKGLHGPSRSCASALTAYRRGRQRDPFRRMGLSADRRGRQGESMRVGLYTHTHTHDVTTRSTSVRCLHEATRQTDSPLARQSLQSWTRDLPRPSTQRPVATWRYSSHYVESCAKGLVAYDEAAAAAAAGAGSWVVRAASLPEICSTWRFSRVL